MLRLTKYLKPFILLILIAVGLLFIQANADLALPDYLSKIVNYGIQQGGFEKPVPPAMRQSQMEKMFSLMSDADKTLVLDKYILLKPESPKNDQYFKQYPALTGESTYFLNTNNPDDINSLEIALTKPLALFSLMEQIAADPVKAAAMSQAMNFDISKVPQGMDFFMMLNNLPPEKKVPLLNSINERLSTLGDSTLRQMAILAAKAEYSLMGGDSATYQTNYILHIGTQMLLVTLLAISCTIAVGWLSARTAAGLARNLRNDIFRKVSDFSKAEFDGFSTASLITRTTNDVTQIQMVVMMMMRMVIYAPIIGIGGVIRAIAKSSSMWWLIALAVVIVVVLVLLVFSIALPKFKIIQSLIDRLSLVMRENLSGIMVIRAFNMQEFEEKRFDKANQDLTKTNLFVNRTMVVMMPVMMLVMNGLSLLIIWVGSHQVAQATMQVGDMMAFMQYAMQILFAFLMMSFMFILLPRAAVSADRIAAVLETKPSIKDPQEPKKFNKDFKANIEFKDVCFRYPDAEEDVLHDISFIAKSGETTAFLGTTGSGKSTIVSLIPRFYDVTGGSVLIDGIDIRQVTTCELRDMIGYVPQRSSLFSGTIESNLRYADENASIEDLMTSVETAQVKDLIDTNPDGLEAAVSQGGTNFSGGQKQRLAIARALVKKAPIYIFDDSFSALDYKTDLALRKALKKTAADSTLLIVTQRIATIKNAEQIIVLDEGRIVGKGTHQELMKTCEVYRGIALSQLSAKELA